MAMYESPQSVSHALRRAASSPGSRLFRLRDPPRFGDGKSSTRVAYLASVFALFLLVVYWTHSGLGSVALTTANVSEPTAAVSVAQPSPTVWTHPVPATAAPMPAAAVPGHRVALVLYGVRFNGLAAFSDRVGAALRRYVAQALNADVFVCGANVDGTEAMVRSSMQGAAIVDVHLREEPDDAHMLEAFRSSPSGAWFARLLGDALPAAVDALQEARWIELAYGRVEAYERAHSIRYEWIHFQRPDLEWFAPHPPLELLERTRLYVPTRRADALPPGSLLCPRDACARFAQFHSLLLNGTVASAMVNEQAPCTPPCSLDRVQMAHLRLVHQPLGVYRNVAAAVCVRGQCAKSSQCNTLDCRAGQKYVYNEEADDFESTKAMMAGLTVKVKGWDGLVGPWDSRSAAQALP